MPARKGGHTLAEKGEAMVANMERISATRRGAEDARNVFANQPVQQRPKALKKLRQRKEQ